MMVSWKKLECEVCKWGLPKKMKINNKVVELVSLKRPDGPYIIAQSTSKATKTSERSMYILNFGSNETIKLGRGHQC